MAKTNVITTKHLTTHVQLKDASDTTSTGDVLYSDITGDADSWLTLQSIEVMGATGTILRFREGEASASGAIFAEMEIQSDSTPVIVYFDPPKRCKPCFDCSTSTYTTGTTYFVWNYV
jgi:hypothetical protein